MRTFQPPRRTFPSDGPIERSFLEGATPRDIASIHVTKANVHQLAHYIDPITPATLRNVFGSFAPTAEDILDDQKRARIFRNWCTTELEPIKFLAENFMLVQGPESNVFVYFPQIYWVDEEVGYAVRSGPFFARPGSSTFLAYDLHGTTSANGRMNQPTAPRWKTMAHPHIRDRSVCLGTEEASYASLYRSKDLYGLMETFENLIQVYNPDSPFVHFNRYFPPSAHRIDPPAENNLVLWSTNYGDYQLDESQSPLGDLTTIETCGYTLNVTDDEINSLRRGRNSDLRSWLSVTFRNLASREINGSLSNPRERDFIMRILPPAPTIREQFEAAGFTFTPGFNASDAEMNGSYTPYKKDYALDFSHTPIDPDQPEEGEDPDESESRAEDSGGDEETSSVDEIAADERPF